MLALRHFFFNFFLQKRFKRAFPTHFEAVNAWKNHPNRQSHLGEPMHGDMGFMCYLNIHFIAQIQLFSLFLFQSKVGPSKTQTLSRKHIQLSLHAYGSHFQGTRNLGCFEWFYTLISIPILHTIKYVTVIWSLCTSYILTSIAKSLVQHGY